MPPSTVVGPPPIHADSTPEQHDLRVNFENQINAGARAFAEEASAAFIDAALRGEEVHVAAGPAPLADDEEPAFSPDDFVNTGDDSDIAPETAAAFAADEGLVPYADWSKDDLAEECRTRGLPVSGTKDELIDRLETSDAEDVASEPEPDPEAEE